MSVWLLTVFDVPDPLAGLLTRLKFKPTRKNPAHWWRRFRSDEKLAARIARGHLVAAGLRGKWREAEAGRSAVSRNGLPRPAKFPAKFVAFHAPRTSRSAGYSASMKNRSNQRRRGRGRRGL